MVNGTLVRSGFQSGHYQIKEKCQASVLGMFVQKLLKHILHERPPFQITLLQKVATPLSPSKQRKWNNLSRVTYRSSSKPLHRIFAK